MRAAVSSWVKRIVYVSRVALIGCFTNTAGVGTVPSFFEGSNYSGQVYRFTIENRLRVLLYSFASPFPEKSTLFLDMELRVEKI